jgi:DNA-binding transcriptional ArsR family regulator
MVLCQLKFGEQSVGELSRNLGIKQSPLSQHLARMRHEGVVTSRRDAQTMYYSIADDKVAQVDLRALRAVLRSDAVNRAGSAAGAPDK